MNPKNLFNLAAAFAVSVSLGSFSALVAEEHDHDHHGHDHGGVEAGPNGGRVLHKIEPHLEFFVTKDRKVQLTALDNKLKAIAIGKQVVKVTAGDRQNPIKMSFVKQGNVLMSETAFPAGDDFPVVVQMKNSKVGKSVIEKFTLNMSPCPTCEYLEYACTCDHGHDGHDHDHDKKKQ